jgi:hypothetical protein
MKISLLILINKAKHANIKMFPGLIAIAFCVEELISKVLLTIAN